jgi:O-methyltransferase
MVAGQLDIRGSAIRRRVRSLYRRLIRPHLSPRWQQRIKLLWTVWGYRAILTLPALSLTQRFTLLRRLLSIDWNLQHAHWPGEITRVIAAIGRRRAGPLETVVEAGCWQGGSTAKLSVACQMLGYKLLVFDSFQGVEYQPGNPFSGQYAAALDLVKANVAAYGEIAVCRFMPGWFADTLAANPVQEPISVVFADCDLATGTCEVLKGIIPSLRPNGVFCSQDYHIKEVRDLLDSEHTWAELGVPKPIMIDLYRNLAVFLVQRSGESEAP